MLMAKIEDQLLSYVLQADEKTVDDCLVNLDLQSNGWKRILEKSAGIEPCKRTWKSVSPLEFAAWIGDDTLLSKLLNHIPQEGWQKALKQLRTVQKTGSEHGRFMAPFHTLLETYNHIKVDCITNQDYINTIGQLQFQLSIFGLQWLFDAAPFDPSLDDSSLKFNFNRSPARQLCFEYKAKHSELLFESSIKQYGFDLGKHYFLTKSKVCGFGEQSCISYRTEKPKEFHPEDCLPEFFQQLCQAKVLSLDKKINELESNVKKTMRSFAQCIPLTIHSNPIDHPFIPCIKAIETYISEKKKNCGPTDFGKNRAICFSKIFRNGSFSPEFKMFALQTLITENNGYDLKLAVLQEALPNNLAENAQRYAEIQGSKFPILSQKLLKYIHNQRASDLHTANEEELLASILQEDETPENSMSLWQWMGMR
jgi:hypothetical protein